MVHTGIGVTRGIHNDVNEVGLEQQISIIYNAG